MIKKEKGGCIIISKENPQKVLLTKTSYFGDFFGFPKGHLENNETLEECAIRETEEETKRKVKLYSEEVIAIDHYFDSMNDEVDMYYYIGIDDGISDNDSTDTHDLIWVDYDEVLNTLTYDSLKKTWNIVKDTVFDIMNK